MLKLYYSPGACSMSPHIVLREAELEFALEKVDLRSKQTESGVDFTTINSKGYVPTLQLADGDVLTEGPAIVQYIADLKPESGLAPANGTLPRYHLQEWLNYISTELHKSSGQLFNPAVPEAYKATVHENLKNRYAYIDQQLSKQDFLLGADFSVADAYCFTVVSWTPLLKIDISHCPNLQAYMERIGQRPSVQAVMEAEGLKKAKG
ncbi:MAG: glutathione transferase GstA [Pseudomonadota bacterium]|nr:glutathione transferase GstA [Pseudomonadota bacterium]